MERINDNRLGGMVSRGIASTRGRNGPVASVVVTPETFMQSSMFVRPGFITQLRMDERQVVMRGDVLGVKSQGLRELRSGQLEPRSLTVRLAPVQFCAFDAGLPQFVNHLVILAEIETALVQFGISVLKDAPQLADGFVQTTVLLVDEPGEPGQSPPRCRRIELRRAVKRSVRRSSSERG